MLAICHLTFNAGSWNNCYTLGNLPPGPDEGVSVPFDGVTGGTVVLGLGPIDGVVGFGVVDLVVVDPVVVDPVVVDPVVVDPVVVDPVVGDAGLVGSGLGWHWLTHPQWLFKLKLCQIISIILVIYRI